MLKRIAIGLAIALLSLGVIDRASLLIAPCGIGGGGYSDQESANDDNCATREGIIVAGVEWLREQAPEFWVAIASFAIAVFTGTLWYSTDKLWRAGERQIRTSRQIATIQAHQTRISNREARRVADATSLNARAAVAVELPILAPLSIALHREPGVIGKVDMPGPISTMRINFKNWGRTHAELISQSVEWLVTAKLPENPVYKTEVAFPPGTFVESGKNLRDAPQDFIIKIQPDEVEAIAKEEKFLWVYCGFR